MENNDTLNDVLDMVSGADDPAENGVKKIKDRAKAYADRLNKDREKIKTQVESEYKSKLSKLLGVEIKDLTQEELDTIINTKIDDSDIVKNANTIIEENNKLKVKAALDENINKIKAINPAVDTVEKLMALPDYAKIEEKHKKGYELYDAYVSVIGFQNNNQPGTQPGVKQGVAANTVAYVQPESISDETLSMYRKAFPGKTDEDIIKLYRRDREN